MAGDKQLSQVIDLLEDRDIMVVTGAGVSTDSGIPDYRGRGMLAKHPLIAHKFERDATYRKKFWVRNNKHADVWLNAEPNDAHNAIAVMEHAGYVTGVVTQNVDGLHWTAMSMVVAELHGNMHTSTCMLCNKQFSQEYVIDEFRRMNPQVMGDRRFWAKKIIEPMCNECGGFLKPSVVFFGDFLPEEEFDLAESIAEDSNAVIVAGTSMKVGTAMSLIRSVKKRGPVIVINRGETMVDHMADVKINAGVGETLQDIMRGLL